MTPISAVVITLNEERRIAACIASLRQITTDIVVVDSGSTDRTRQICQAEGARFFYHPWKGYSAQKNFGNQQALHHWILSIDADERLSPELANVIRQHFATEPECHAFSLPFITNFCGKWIKHGGWYPQRHIRLFDKREIAWDDNFVHEGLCIKPEHRVVYLKGGHIEHYTVDSLAEAVVKTDKYSTLFAQKAFASGKKFSPLKMYLSPAFRFFSEFVLRMGFLDGKAGYYIARENTHYTYLKYRKLRDLYAGKAIA